MSISQKTVIQLCPRLGSGGVERGTVDLAIAVKEAGFDSIVISGGGFLESELEAAGVQHIKIPIYSKNPLIFITNLIRLSKILRQLKPDIIHPHSRIPTWLVFILRKKLTSRFITSCDGVHSMDKLGFKKIYNGVLSKGDFIIASSQVTEKYLINNYDVPEKKRLVIYPGVDLNSFSFNAKNSDEIAKLKSQWHIPLEKVIILLPARICYLKGQVELVEAAAILKNKYGLQFTCLLVGSKKNKSYLNQVEQKISLYGLESEFIMLGEQSNPAQFYAMADVVVSTSIQPEAFGRTMVEAQLMKKPIVASAHGGACEIISSGETGWLYPPGDATGLAEIIAYVSKMHETDKLKVLNNAAQQAQLRFSKMKMCDAHLELYRGL